MQLASLLNSREQYLSEIIRIKQQELKNKPSGSLKIVKHGNGWQYYSKLEGDERYSYIKKENQDQAKQLAQARFDEKILELALEEKELLVKLQELYKHTSVDTLYSKQTLQRQQLITPIEEPLDRYVDLWINTEYPQNGFRDDMPEYYSENGEQMRSKSEVLIANMLSQAGIVYRYEKPLTINGLGTIYPDFTLLDIQNRTEIYWEHFGMMDDLDYVEKAMRKLNKYEQAGYLLGKNLIVSYETTMQPINMKVIERKIESLKSLSYFNVCPNVIGSMKANMKANMQTNMDANAQINMHSQMLSKVARSMKKIR